MKLVYAPSLSMLLKKLLLIFILLFTSEFAKAGWNQVNIGINDHFNSVLFMSSTHGLIAGNHGIYFTTTGGGTASDWTRFTFTNDPSYLELYNNCQFKKIAVYSDYTVYICGTDTVNKRAIIFKLDLSNLRYSFAYVGPKNSSLNALAIINSYLFAVGNNGLVLTSSNFTDFTKVETGLSNNLFSVYPKTIRIYGIAGDGVFILIIANQTVYKYPDDSIRVLSYNQASDKFLAFGNKHIRYENYGATRKEFTNYDFAPLYATSACNIGQNYYVSTNHGIYYQNGPLSEILEYMPSSNNLSLNDVYFYGFEKGYAVGNNGVFIKTTDSGGGSKPFATSNVIPNCKDTITTLHGSSGTGTWCKWLLNNKLIASSCSINYVFETAGQFNLDYIVTNSFNLSDTASKSIIVVDPPQINLPVTISDSILCKNQTIQITIQNTQKDFTYILKKKNSGSSYGSGFGNGGTMTFNSNLLDSAGYYYITVRSNFSHCEKYFTDSIKLQSEKTKVSFNYDLINAFPNENVNFYSKSHDAQNYYWSFQNNSNVLSSNDPNPTGIRFADTGQIVVTLIAESVNHCFDTIIANGPYVCKEPNVEDTCWAEAFIGEDPLWDGRGYHQISQSCLSKDDYLLICGNYSDHVFRSRYGKKINTPKGKVGSYITKYSPSGTIKWLNSIQMPNTNSSDMKSTIYSVTTDKYGNIYVTGSVYDLSQNVYYYQNNGDSILISNIKYHNSYVDKTFILKLDSLGHYIWHAELFNIISIYLKADSNGNLLAYGISGKSPSSTIIYRQNGFTDSCFAFTNKKIDQIGYSLQNYVLRINENGSLKWFTFISKEHNEGLIDAEMDSFGNIYITGTYDIKTTFFSTNGDSVNIKREDNESSRRMYVVKYNDVGVLQWQVRARIINNLSYDTDVITPYKIQIDPNGTCYILGHTSFFNYRYQEYMKVINADMSITIPRRYGSFFLMKLSPSGIAQWITGNSYSNYGDGSAFELKGSQLYLINTLHGYNNSAWSGYYYSANFQDSIYVPNINYGDFLVANYDTSGALHWISLGGNTLPTGYLHNLVPTSISTNTYGHHFITGTTHGGTEPAILFGDTVSINRYDAFFSKMGVSGCETTLVNNTEINIPTTSKQASLIIYPNPATNTLHISGIRPKSIVKIYDVLGHLIIEKESEYNMTLNTSQLSEGIYTIIAQSNNSRSINKVVITK
ncbi:MAG: T9SS type A sorting domain-containing protein [Saprospiraceae bacterium]|nr:T9SS type A sorting domain-containing protein [Candidatus Defluviibacterium haderslevense]